MKNSINDKLKTKILKVVDSYRDKLIDLSLKIHDNPELGFKEVKASLWLTSFLKKNGFQIEKNAGNLATAFKATYGSGSPVLALLAEYDALPEIGHACGHNIIAASAVGGAIASKLAVDKYGGTVAVIGTPAEEGLGGKLPLLEKGVFADVDAAMIVHPGTRNIATVEALACINLTVEFFGRAAHAAASPEQGINALEAMILSFNAVNSLRQHMKDRARIHGIITHGGDAPNIIPDYTKAEIMVRAPDIQYLDVLKQQVLDCFAGGAIATGARLEHKWSETCYLPMKNNLTLADIFVKNMELLGLTVEPFEFSFGFGSTDMGNISQAVPAIHPEMAIASPDMLLHSKEFAAAAVSTQGNTGMLNAAKVLAMTVSDLLNNKKYIAKIKAEFHDNRKGRE